MMKRNMEPKMDASVFVADGAKIVGDVTIGKNCGVWYNAVIRGDDEPIVIGDNTNVQDNATLHTGVGFPLHVGNNVSIGHNAIVHGCDVGNDTLIGMGAIIMNGAKVGKNCVIGAGAVVTEGKDIPDGSLCMGIPAKVIREVTESDIAHTLKNANHYVSLANEHKTAE